jgi:hypothetical protein
LLCDLLSFVSFYDTVPCLRATISVSSLKSHLWYLHTLHPPSPSGMGAMADRGM